MTSITPTTPVGIQQILPPSTAPAALLTQLEHVCAWERAAVPGEDRFMAANRIRDAYTLQADELNLSGCCTLTSLPALPTSLHSLALNGCSALTELPDLPPDLSYLSLHGCASLSALPPLPESLSYLIVYGCRALPSISSPPFFIQADDPSLRYFDHGERNALCRLDAYTEQLTAYRDKIKALLASTMWPSFNIEMLDKNFLPDFAHMANLAKPGLHLRVAADHLELAEMLQQALREGMQSARFISNIGDGRIHFAVFDYRLIGGIASIIEFEPANIDAHFPLLLARLSRTEIHKQLPLAVIKTVAMDIQRSPSECGMFSLVLAKKLHAEAAPLTTLHQLNIAGKLPHQASIVAAGVADRYLPPSLFKHTQSRARLELYLAANPSAAQTIVNKKAQTLSVRQAQRSEYVDDKPIVKSMHEFRLKQAEALLNQVLADAIEKPAQAQLA